MSLSAYLRTAILATLTACICATAAAAQAPAVTHPRADVLFKRAEAMGTQATGSFDRHMRRTADLYVKSADLRAYGDPLKVESLRRAGGLLMRLDPGSARALLERAGDVALATREVFQAASLYTDAAWVMVNYPYGSRADFQAAADCLDLARHLIDGPSITDEQRSAILQRIDGATARFAVHQTSIS